MIAIDRHCAQLTSKAAAIVILAENQKKTTEW